VPLMQIFDPLSPAKVNFCFRNFQNTSKTAFFNNSLIYFKESQNLASGCRCIESFSIEGNWRDLLDLSQIPFQKNQNNNNLSRAKIYHFSQWESEKNPKTLDYGKLIFWKKKEKNAE